MANTNANGRVVAPAVLQPQLSTDVVGFNLENNQASTLGQQYITFQETFLPGEVATGTDLVAIVNGQKIPVQMDVKTFNDDGSVRSALLTFQQPSIAAHSSLSFMLSTTGTDFTTGALSLANLNGSNFDLKISIALQGGSTVVLDAATLLQQALNAGTVSYWQSGPLATQGRVDVPIAGSLHVTLDITRYADGSTSTDVQFNNDYAMQSVGGTAVYNVTIQQNGSTVLQQSNITEYQYQTWHTVVSTTGTAQANVVQDIDHLQDTGAIPNLDLAAGVDPSDLSAERITGNQILGPGSVTQYMPTAGGRADIGLMPGWNAIWLITQDEQAAKYALAQADVAGSVPWHYFDPKTGTYLSVTDYPTLWADPRGTPTLTQQPSSSSGWTPDAAHQPDLSYLAYLMTGDRYYLDQLNAQATFAVFSDWNVLRQNGLGLVANGSDEVRAQAWSLRVIDEAAWANPAGSVEQTYFAKLADNNWSWLVSQIPIWTQQEGQAYGYVPGTYGNNSAMAPWQQDYFASVAIEAAQMGNADALTFLNWEANFLVGRFLNSASGFNPHDGAAYNLTVANGNGVNYQTWAQIGQATVAAGNSNGSGWADGNFAELAAQTLAGIITLTGSAAATQAYNWLMSSGAPQITPYFVDPQFDVVPDQPVNTGNATLSIVAVNSTQSEGTTGATTPFTFTITRGGNTSIASSAGWAVTGSGANAAAASDFAGSVLPSGTVSFAAGETSKTITVNVAGDTVVEPDEGFTVTLSNPAASTTIGTATASGTIRNDETSQASLSIAALSADKVEGQSGSTAFTFTVTRGGNTSIASSAGWAVTGSGANAAAASDFAGSVLPSGTVSFTAGETSKTITVNVAGDTVVEPDEGFTVTLSNPAASTTIGTATASGTIRNDDVTTTTIEAFGATRLVKVGNQFQLLDASNSGPTVKYQGGVVTAGQFGAWTPLGAEKVGTGYQMVWQNGGADQYLVWNTDSNGTWKSQTDVGSGSSYALQSL
ncbi:Calx-beta domain-containing protein, partial [Rhodospirillales bacterium URHD0017]